MQKLFSKTLKIAILHIQEYIGILSKYNFQGLQHVLVVINLKVVGNVTGPDREFKEETKFRNPTVHIRIK